MSALLLYLASHWVLVIITVLAVVALGAAAYVFKNLKFALAAIAVAIAGFMYQGAVMHGVNLQIERDMAIKVALLNGRITTLNTASEKDAALAIEDAKEIERLKGLSSETPANGNACLDVDAARRVRNIR
jgi:hypothetical protein